ncbi:hypothetical protein H5410_025201 [Solanum commersonii]|uniref:Uncharacterized protein n=1 Tax=Solanum commersonii TaxID=4109 RepID=A0A9J5YV39_SOLCO|nr:hypothetical protein H5410_025201 [Solanum commersonii]
MKEYWVSESWTKDRILVDSIPRGMVDFNFQPILMWKDGEILIHGRTKLASYNPKMKSFMLVNVYSEVTTAIIYIPSFYSLKTIMGDDFQLRNVYLTIWVNISELKVIPHDSLEQVKAWDVSSHYSNITVNINHPELLLFLGCTKLAWCDFESRFSHLSKLLIVQNYSYPYQAE